MQKEIQLIKEINEEDDWLRKNYESIRKEYKNKFVAVKDKKVIECDEHLEKLMKKLERKQVNAAQTLIEFIPEKSMLLIL